MAKTKTEFYCQNCGARASKWLGRCPSCNEWNTYAEEIISPEPARQFAGQTATASVPRKINEIDAVNTSRIPSGQNELDRVLGGGIVPGSLVLIGGEPGIGKSTLMLQMALQLKNRKVLYVSGEESEEQIRLRANRLYPGGEECFVVSETTTTEIFNHINRINPDVIIIDSVQTLYMPEIGSAPGSVSQVRECTAVFQRFAKQKAIPVFLVGHITKDGSLAGPKVMEHMVDTVLQFEGDRHHVYRILRAQKNRFGPASELGIYEMKSDGLAEVENPSSVLLSHRDENISGVAVSSSVEGLRPMMIEVQALVSTAAYGVPQRSATGFDLRRMNMLLAVLEKRCGFRISVKDVFLNIAGGLRVDDPAIDMSVVTAVLSSSEDIPVSMKYCFAGEIGLSGEIRPVSRIEQRVEEARKLGFDTIFISGYNSIQSKGIKGIRVAPVRKVNELFAALFG